VSHVVYSFYQFHEITSEQLTLLQSKVRDLCSEHSILGTILLAPEGGNFNVSGKTSDLDAFMISLCKNTIFDIQHINKTYGEQKPFPRLKVKIQDSIITFLDKDPDVESIRSGKRISPNELQEMLNTNPDNVQLIDTRNLYEAQWGTFKNAKVFDIDKFSEFPDKFKEEYNSKKDKKYVMFCTGGVRCEKAAVWAENEGYENVYQLDGGILSYMNQHKENSHWDGKCFVFDRRWAVGANLTEVHDEKDPKSFKQPKQYFDSEFSHYFAFD